MEAKIYVKPLLGLLTLALAALAAASGTVGAQQAETFFLVPRWHQIVLEPGEMVVVPATAENRGTGPVEFIVSWEKTPGPAWETGIRGALTNFQVIAVAMPAGDTRSLSLEIKAPDEVEAGGEQEVKLKIQPTQDAIPGDYRLSVAAVAEGASDTVDIVITVTQSTIWGWVGLAAVLAVAVGMVGLFLRLGRR